MYLRVWYFFILLSVVQLHGQSPVDRINDYYKRNYSDSALMLIDQYEPVYQSSSQWDSLVAVIRLKAVVYSSIKPLPDALKVFSEAEAYAMQYLALFDREYMLVKLNKGDCLSRMGRNDQALEYYDEVIELANSAGDTTGLEARALGLKSWLYVAQLKYQKALLYAQEANREILRVKNLDSTLLMGNYGALSQIYHFMTIPDSTLYYGQKWLKLAQRIYPPDHNNLGFAYTSLAGYHYDLREMDQAIKYMSKAGDIFYRNYQKSGNSRYLAVSLANKGMMYGELQEYTLAINFYHKAIELLEIEYGANNPFMLEFYQALADIHMQAGHLTESKTWLDKVKKVLDSDHSIGKEIRNNVQSYFLRYYRLSGDLSTANDIAQELLDYHQRSSAFYSSDEFNTLYEMAQIKFAQHEKEQALSWFYRALSVSDSVFSSPHPLSIGVLVDIMGIYLDQGDLDKVEDVSQQILNRRSNGQPELNIKNCIPIFELLDYSALWSQYLQVRITSGDEDPSAYVDFITDFEAYYNQHLSMVRSNDAIRDNSVIIKKIYKPGIEFFAVNKPHQSLIYSEKIKSFLTRILLQSQLVRQDDGSLPLRRRLSNLLSQYAEENDQDILIETGEVMEKLNEYKDSLYRTNQENFSRIFGFPDVGTDEIRSSIEGDEILLEYTFLDSMLYIFGYDKSQSFVVTLPKVMIDSLLDIGRDSYNPELLNKLYNLLIPQKARSFSRLFIVPDEKLFYLNFEELMDDQGRFLIHSKTIRYAYSASINSYQTQLASQKMNSENVIAFTPGFMSSLKQEYLSNAGLQVIDSFWLYFLQQPFLLELAEKLGASPHSKSYTHSYANERTFKKGTENYQIVHLGTHGLINDSSPLFSRLVFAKDTLEDGYLHTYEIFGMDLNASLAVLSACETGTGTYVTGEGVSSLAHGFTHAGCPSVLMSLWKIDEKSSSLILDGFYDYLKKGQSKSTALRNAKLDFLASAPSEMKEPYYWAGLVIMGDDSPIVFAGVNPWTKWLLVGLAVLIVFYFGRRFISRFFRVTGV